MDHIFLGAVRSESIDSFTESISEALKLIAQTAYV
jgi:hypothetical protein